MASPKVIIKTLRYFVAWLSTNCCVTARTDHRSQQSRIPLCSPLRYLSREWTNQQKRSFRWGKGWAVVAWETPVLNQRRKRSSNPSPCLPLSCWETMDCLSGSHFYADVFWHKVQNAARRNTQKCFLSFSVDVVFTQQSRRERFAWIRRELCHDDVTKSFFRLIHIRWRWRPCSLNADRF